MLLRFVLRSGFGILRLALGSSLSFELPALCVSRSFLSVR